MIGETAQAEELEESATSEPGVESETETEEVEVKEEKDPPAKPRKKRADERIGELTAIRRDVERDRDHWRDLYLQSQKPKEAEPLTKPPTLESVEYDEAKYQEAMSQWVKQQVQTELQSRDEQVKKQAEQKAQEEKQRSFHKKASDFAKNHSDYWEVAHDDNLPVSPAMAEIIQESDRGPEVLYHLGNNPELAAQIYQMSPTQAALEIGRLEAKLSLPQPKKTTNAPPPLNTLSGGGETASKDPDTMSTAEWLKWREEQVAKR